MFKQISMQQLKHKAMVTSKLDLIKHPDYLVLILWIVPHQILQQLVLLLCKLVVQFCVPGYLDRHLLFEFMVDALNHLCEWPLSKNPQYFISVMDVVAHFHSIVTFLVIKSLLDLTFPQDFYRGAANVVLASPVDWDFAVVEDVVLFGLQRFDFGYLVGVEVLFELGEVVFYLVRESTAFLVELRRSTNFVFFRIASLWVDGLV